MAKLVQSESTSGPKIAINPANVVRIDALPNYNQSKIVVRNDAGGGVSSYTIDWNFDTTVQSFNS